MSADNGIYILKTPDENYGYRYRVTHAQAIENIWYENKEGDAKTVIEIFGDATPMSQQQARDFAFDLAALQEILEYGISEIELPHPFEWYVEASNQSEGGQ